MKKTLIAHLRQRIWGCKQVADNIRRWLHRKLSTKIPQPIADEEFLARFVLHSRYICSSNQTIKSAAFIPRPYPDLSVTRHKGFSENQLWNIGLDIATAQSRTLYGRADVSAASVRQQSLTVKPDPIPRNPNHANILGWPKEKSAQKIIAQKLAAASIYQSNPQPTA